MSVFIDELARIIEQSTADAEATRADWQRALDQAFPPERLDPIEPAHGTEEYGLVWEIDGDGTSPADAALRVWRQTFRRGPLQPSADEACVFIVLSGDRRVQIDLSEDRYAHLFDD